MSIFSCFVSILAQYFATSHLYELFSNSFFTRKTNSSKRTVIEDSGIDCFSLNVLNP